MSQSPGERASILRPHLDEQRLTRRLAELVRARSENPPGDEAEAAGRAAAMCEEEGFTVTVHEPEPRRTSIVARRGSGRPAIVFCSHLDVVPAGDERRWGRDPFAAEVADGTLFGRGSADAKASIAAALEAAAMLAGAELAGRGTLILALVADEEAMGLKGAAPLVAAGELDADAAIVGEPTSLKVVHAQRGASWFRIVTGGRAAHGSAPERGRNAIVHMAEVIAQLPRSLPDIDHPLLGGPSVNVGVIRGGSKVNVVADRCEIELDRRTLPGEDEDSVRAGIEAALAAARRRVPDLQAEVMLELSGGAFEVSADAAVVRAMAAGVTAATGAPARLTGFRGASDARFFAEAGIDAIVCGPGDIAVAHTADERVDLSEVAAGAVAYAVALSDLLAAGP